MFAYKSPAFFIVVDASVRFKAVVMNIDAHPSMWETLQIALDKVYVSSLPPYHADCQHRQYRMSLWEGVIAVQDMRNDNYKSVKLFHSG